jgi:hypothetical protein
MALAKSTSADKIEVVNGRDSDNNPIKIVQVRTTVTVTEDGEIISQNYQRHVIHSGDDWTSEPSNVQTVCNAVFA